MTTDIGILKGLGQLHGSLGKRQATACENAVLEINRLRQFRERLLAMLQEDQFESDLATAVNHCSRENASTPDKLSASEAVFGVLAWLSTRSESLTIGASHECSIVAQLAREFCEVNGLAEPRKRWADNLIHPSGECSQVNN